MTKQEIEDFKKMHNTIIALTKTKKKVRLVDLEGYGYLTSMIPTGDVLSAVNGFTRKYNKKYSQNK